MRNSNLFNLQHHRSKHAAAFSLIELIISMALMVIIGGIIASIIAANFKILREVSDRKKFVSRGLQAVNLFQREVGMLTDSTNIVTADDQTFSFNDKFGNTWEYDITSSDFTRKALAGTARILATPVVNASTGFQYFEADNAELTSTPLSASDLKLVRLVKLKLTMDDGYGGVSLLAVVYPENLVSTINHWTNEAKMIEIANSIADSKEGASTLSRERIHAQSGFGFSLIAVIIAIVMGLTVSLVFRQVTTMSEELAVIYSASQARWSAMSGIEWGSFKAELGEDDVLGTFNFFNSSITIDTSAADEAGTPLATNFYRIMSVGTFAEAECRLRVIAAFSLQEAWADVSIIEQKGDIKKYLHPE